MFRKKEGRKKKDGKKKRHWKSSIVKGKGRQHLQKEER